MKKLLFTFLCIALGVIQMNASVGDTTYYFQSEIDSLSKELEDIKNNSIIYSNCLINPAFTQDQNRQALQGDSVFLSKNKDIDYGGFYRDFDLSKYYLISENRESPHKMTILVYDKRFAWELFIFSVVSLFLILIFLKKRGENYNVEPYNLGLRLIWSSIALLLFDLLVSAGLIYIVNSVSVLSPYYNINLKLALPLAFLLSLSFIVRFKYKKINFTISCIVFILEVLLISYFFTYAIAIYSIGGLLLGYIASKKWNRNKGRKVNDNEDISEKEISVV
ncbi:MAG: hypothetical protein ACI9AR_000279 [Flavobacteriaceae bacterium]|jgi:hypothetical protein